MVTMVVAEGDESSRLPSGVDMYPKAITLCGLSKSWGLPGLRLGWVTCKDKQLLQKVKLITVKHDQGSACCAGSELLVLAYWANQ
jgi:aspartate/methionine/tyrosine aminotransferase